MPNESGMEYGGDFDFAESESGPSSMACSEVDALRKELSEFQAKEGPLNSERWTLDDLLEQLERFKKVASGKTCVSFENLCMGASSLWHQTHRDNFRKVDRKPEALSRWVLKHDGSVAHDFPEQVLAILVRLDEENQRLKANL